MKKSYFPFHLLPKSTFAHPPSLHDDNPKPISKSSEIFLLPSPSPLSQGFLTHYNRQPKINYQQQGNTNEKRKTFLAVKDHRRHPINPNHLTGIIPASIRKLRNLESLDLSQNNPSGEIPGQLADVTSLEVLNVSYNGLVGSIPQVCQFATFTNDSFLGELRTVQPFTHKAMWRSASSITVAII